MRKEQLPKLTAAQFGHWRELMEEYTGVQIAPDREDHVKNGVCKRLQELGEESADDYFNRIAGVGGEQERRLMIDRLLIKETQFFRHRPSFDYLTRIVASNLVKEHSSVTAWSVGCATGEEAYSLSMAINNAYILCQLKPLFGVVGSDICHTALGRARLARYLERQLRQVSPVERRQYFTDLGDGQYQVADSISKRVCFLKSNILDIPKGSFASNLDIIFCQNVLIYFKRWRRKEILHSLAQCLKPGGRMILGLGECIDVPSELLERDSDRGVLAYIRTG